MVVTILLLMLLSFLGVVAAIYSRPCVVCPWKDKEVQGGTNRSQQKTQQDENDQSASPLALVCPLLYPTPPSPHALSPRIRFGIELVDGDGHELLGAGVSASSSSSPAAAAGGGGGGGSASGAGPSLGRVLPLHCGHNNAYGNAERRMLLEHLAQQG